MFWVGERARWGGFDPAHSQPGFNSRHPVRSPPLLRAKSGVSPPKNNQQKRLDDPAESCSSIQDSGARLHPPCPAQGMPRSHAQGRGRLQHQNECPGRPWPVLADAHRYFSRLKPGGRGSTQQGPFEPTLLSPHGVDPCGYGLRCTYQAWGSFV